MPPRPVIALHSRWIRKQVAIEVEVTRVTFRTVYYIAIDKTFSGRCRSGCSSETSSL